jgi:hypothetical protein
MDMQFKDLTPIHPEAFNCYVPDRARINGINSWSAYVLSLRKRAGRHLEDPVKTRLPVPCVDPLGRHFVADPVGLQGDLFAQLDPGRWVEMRESGADGVLGIRDNGKGTLKVSIYPPLAGRKRLPVPVTRYLLNPKSDEVVRFRNGDPLDLRMPNLELVRQARAPDSKPRKDARSEVQRGVARRQRAIAEGRKFRRDGGSSQEA